MAVSTPGTVPPAASGLAAPQNVQLSGSQPGPASSVTAPAAAAAPAPSPANTVQPPASTERKE
jgi:general secretion pathway protein D